MLRRIGIALGIVTSLIAIWDFAAKNGAYSRGLYYWAYARIASSEQAKLICLDEASHPMMGKGSIGRYYYDMNALRALEFCARAIKDHPKDEAVRFAYARALYRSGHRQAATVEMESLGGYPPAETWLGRQLVDGEGFRPNPEKAIELHLSAASKGNRFAILQLGSIAENGIGMLPDQEIAASCYLKAGKDGEPHAYRNLGNLIDRTCVAPNSISADQAYKNAKRLFVRLPGGEGRYAMARMAEFGHGENADMSKALQLYREAADLGSVRAMNRIGWLHDPDNKKRLQKDLPFAISRYEEAARLDLPDALTALGIKEIMGGTAADNASSANRENGMKKLEEAARMGGVWAINTLGDYYATLGRVGRLSGLQPDYEKSLLWFRRSAERGSARGRARIIQVVRLMVQKGIKDQDKVHSLLQEAAFQRQLLMAQCRPDIAKDWKTSFDWLESQIFKRSDIATVAPQNRVAQKIAEACGKQ